MIISHKHKYIFLKTNKTAGTSVEIVLSRYCGKDDVITPISPEDEEIRRNLGYRGPQNYYLPYSKYTIRDWAKFILENDRPQYFNHISAKLVKRYVGQDIWNNYFKFCFVRNPWDLVISRYYWHHKSEPRPSISEFIESDAITVLKKRGIDVYTIDGEIAVDKVCRFENLQTELSDICKNQFNIQGDVELPRVKAGIRKDKRHYRDILTREEARKIGEMFSRETVLLDYEY